jgi:ribose 5-phosphate isomerase B
MRIAVCSDEPYPVHALVLASLAERGHSVVPFGSIASGREEPFALVAEQAALALARGVCDEGVFFCWSGTGISIAANKIAGVRAALCTDATTARAARVWNHANVLCLSNRSLSADVAREILDAWFEPNVDARGNAGAAELAALDARHRR